MPSAEYLPATVKDDGLVKWQHFVQTAWMAAILLVVRLVLEQTVLTRLQRRFAKLKGGKGRAKQVFDNCYIVVWSLATEALAIYVTLYLNGGCKPWATDACLTGWPKHSVGVLQKWWVNFLGGRW